MQRWTQEGPVAQRWAQEEALASEQKKGRGVISKIGPRLQGQEPSKIQDSAAHLANTGQEAREALQQ